MDAISRKVVTMKYSILAEIRENYPSRIQGDTVYNDYVSQKSMLDFCGALNNVGFKCDFLGGIKQLFDVYLNGDDISDTVFINYNYGLPANYKRGQCPTLLELMKAKYSGADPFTALLVNDKEFTKRILRSAGIRTPNSILAINNDNLYERIEKCSMALPFVVKPNCEGSSLGITSKSLCLSYHDAYTVANDLLSQYGEVIIEQYIAGYECTVWLIGNPGRFLLVAPLLISEKGTYFFERKIFTMQDKASHVREYSLPEKTLDNNVVQRLKNISKRIFSELGLRDYARLDFRIAEHEIYFIEANALPIFSQTSEIGSVSRLYNISYEDICKMIVNGINTRLGIS